MSTKKLYLAWLALAEKNGALLATYPCPSCLKEIKAALPPKGQQFDSLVVCPHCELPHMKVVYDDGYVDTKLVFRERACRQGSTRAGGKS